MTEYTYTTASTYEKYTDWAQTKPGLVMDPIEAAHWYDKEHGTRTNWHVMSAVLDAMQTAGRAERTGKSYDGMAEYRIIA